MQEKPRSVSPSAEIARKIACIGLRPTHNPVFVEEISTGTEGMCSG